MGDDLADHHAGEASWVAFAAAFGDALERCPARDELRAAVGDEALAAVIAGSVPTATMAWLTAAIPALNGRTPASCLRTPRGRRRLQEMLMRMPR